MSNGIDFKVMVLGLRAQLNACEQSKADLLEALEVVLDSCEFAVDDMTGAYYLDQTDASKARAAIAKARGEK